MSYSSRTTGQIISEKYFDTLWNMLENYRNAESLDNDTTKQQVAIVTILNDFTEGIE